VIASIACGLIAIVFAAASVLQLSISTFWRRAVSRAVYQVDAVHAFVANRSPVATRASW
jgi:hypothetical protein